MRVNIVFVVQKLRKYISLIFLLLFVVSIGSSTVLPLMCHCDHSHHADGHSCCHFVHHDYDCNKPTSDLRTDCCAHNNSELDMAIQLLSNDRVVKYNLHVKILIDDLLSDLERVIAPSQCTPQYLAHRHTLFDKEFYITIRTLRSPPILA